MLHIEACPVCSSGEIATLFTCTDFLVTKELFPVVKCSKCGFIFTQDQPEDTGKYYESEEYISHSDTSAGLVNKLYRLARSYMLKKKLAIIKKATSLNKGSLLDIGSGTGYFPGAMKKAGWDAIGVEINKKARDFSRRTFGLEVSDPAFIGETPSKSRDCVTMWHVLEHFDDPFRYMHETSRILKDEGTCIVALPNCNSFDAEYYGNKWAAWDVPRHLWHFNPSSFRKLAAKTGFEIVGIKRLPLDVFYISILSERISGSRQPILPGILNGFRWWFLSLFRTKRSSSLVYILKKAK
jgi:2-polyprenyl-3-methyl-5-hydroxy-6-metoxy-1,4-benzoquinol methylase